MLFYAYAFGAHAQDNPPPQEPKVEQQAPEQAAPAPVQPPPSEAAADAGIAAASDTPAGPPPVEDAGAPRGEAPVSAEAIIGESVGALEEELERKLEAVPQTPRGRPGAQGPAPSQRTAKKAKATPPLVIWATAGWGNALGPARCEKQALEGLTPAIHMASTLKRSVAIAGVGFAPSGVLIEHPLLEYAAAHEPERLATWLATAGFSTLAVGAGDLSGPLMRYPQLSDALIRRGITPIATNLHCNGQAFCRHWATAEKPLHVVERAGQRYVFISLLPDDTTMRVEPTGGEVVLQPLTEAWNSRMKEARSASAQLVVTSIDHGPDATAASRVADLLETLPRDPRPDLLLSPSSGENLLFLRPIDVQPAVVGTRRGVVTGIRVNKLQGGRDADVLARGVRLFEWDEALAAELAELGANYCKAKEKALPGGNLELPLSFEGLVPLAASAARELADADVAVIDPLVFDARFGRPDGVRLQRGEIERAVISDAPLVTANVSLDWLGQVSRSLDGLRPLAMTDYAVDGNVTLVAGRMAVVGASYRVVTTSVLARSDRIPGGPAWRPLEGPNATLRGALLTHMATPSDDDPRRRVEDLSLATQWVLRIDGQLFGNLTEAYNSQVAGRTYDEPALKVNDSKQLGLRFVLNFDADAPKFLFENALNITFDRNFETKTTAVDLSFIQSSYTYRGLWPKPLLYPHPFVEAYGETQLAALDERWLFRPKLGVRSNISRVAAFKAYAGIQYQTVDPDMLPGNDPVPGLGAEFQLKPWTIALDNGTVQLEGNIIYFWSAPGSDSEQHLVRGQLISSYQLIGPLQVTLTAIGAMRKDADKDYIGRAVGMQFGVRLRFVTRDMSD
jgi:hypothetical protein